jgi:hypothetical protein
MNSKISKYTCICLYCLAKQLAQIIEKIFINSKYKYQTKIKKNTNQIFMP